jgi:hypothetical protein
MEQNLEKFLNIKLILNIFKQFSGLKINFHRSEFFGFGHEKDSQVQYQNLFGCESGAFPFKYLGILIHFCKLKYGE